MNRSIKSKPTLDSLTLTHINIRSLKKNFDEMYAMLECLSIYPNIICLSESRIKNKPLINAELSGYNFFNVGSENNVGGVATYVNNNLKIYIRNKIHLHGCKSIWLNVHLPHTTKKFVKVVSQATLT